MKAGNNDREKANGRWMMHGESGVLRGGLGYFFLFQDQLFGREDLLRESKIADGAAMDPSRADGVP